MECARLGPDKVHGVGAPHFWPGCRNAGSTVTPSVFHPPQTSCASPARCPDAILSSAHCVSLVFEGTTVTQHCPDDACQLGGERDDHDVGVSPGEQLAYPCADPRGR